MSELITEDRPRIKFSTVFVGHLDCKLDNVNELQHLSAVMTRMESLGAAPILNDGQVAGNCAISPRAIHSASKSDPSSTGNQACRADCRSQSQGPLDGLALVSMSGKPPGHLLIPDKDFVLVTGFDRPKWAAEYMAVSNALRPSSDSPLLVAALAHSADYGWTEEPAVVLHGHALAEGEGLEYAAKLGVPISPRATLFSTLEDLEELEGLFRSHPYPAHRCYVRRGHGFFLLGRSVAEAEELFRQLIEPWLLRGERGAAGGSRERGERVDGAGVTAAGARME